MPTTPPLPNNRIHTRLGVCLCWCMGVLAALLLNACGPGTGGTGTGPIASASATAAGLNGSYFSNAAASPTATPSATPNPPGGNCTVSCAGSLEGQAVRLYLQTDRIELATPCATFIYVGAWGVSAAGNVTVQGVLESPLATNGPSSQSVSLTVLITDILANAVSVSLKDGAGKLLLAPVALQRAAGTPSSVTANGCQSGHLSAK